jgi:hypothetical protein
LIVAVVNLARISIETNGQGYLGAGLLTNWRGGLRGKM